METYRLSTFALQTALARRCCAEQSNVILLIPFQTCERNRDRDNDKNRENGFRAHRVTE